MRILSLFSGIGGFDLAFRNQGHQIIGACEIDRYARQIYGKHFPGIKIYEDATKIKPDELPDFDCIAAGFPCQTFSTAGKRLGFEESRGTLFFEIARIARQKRPRLLLLENVKGLLSHDNGKTFAVILSTLDELGYDAQWQVLNSKYFVPQNRERIFIVGHLRDTPRPKIFPFRETIEEYNGSRQQTQEKGKRVPDKIVGAIDANYHKGGGTRTMISKSKLKTIHPSNSESYRIYSSDGISKTLASVPGGMGGKTGLYTGASQGIFDGVDQVRRLTPGECEKLQGFPIDYTKYGKDNEIISDNQRYRCLGNAVTVPVIEFIVERLK